MEEIVGEELRHGLESGSTAALIGEAKFVGIYFGAHWAPPCRLFTTNLKETYEVMNQNEKQFEVIFVSGDGNEQAFENNFKEMPWLAVNFKEEDLRSRLKQKYGINSIPTLIIVDQQGRTVESTTGRQEITDHKELAIEIWEKK